MGKLVVCHTHVITHHTHHWLTYTFIPKSQITHHTHHTVDWLQQCTATSYVCISYKDLDIFCSTLEGGGMRLNKNAKCVSDTCTYDAWKYIHSTSELPVNHAKNNILFRKWPFRNKPLGEGGGYYNRKLKCLLEACKMAQIVDNQ